jgi:hypothetical protein
LPVSCFASAKPVKLFRMCMTVTKFVPVLQSAAACLSAAAV